MISVEIFFMENLVWLCYFYYIWNICYGVYLGLLFMFMLGMFCIIVVGLFIEVGK